MFHLVKKYIQFDDYSKAKSLFSNEENHNVQATHEVIFEVAERDPIKTLIALELEVSD